MSFFLFFETDEDSLDLLSSLFQYDFDDETFPDRNEMIEYLIKEVQVNPDKALKTLEEDQDEDDEDDLEDENQQYLYKTIRIHNWPPWNSFCFWFFFVCENFLQKFLFTAGFKRTPPDTYENPEGERRYGDSAIQGNIRSIALYLNIKLRFIELIFIKRALLKNGGLQQI
jgi:hypothetical protein